MWHEGSISPETRVLSVPLAVGALATGFVGMAFAARAVGDWPLRTVLAVGETTLVIPAALAIVVAGVPWGAAALGRRPTAQAYFLGLLCGIPLWIASLGILEIQFAIWAPNPVYVEEFRSLHAALRPAGPWDALVSVLVIALLPAVAEELLCRGVLFSSLAARYGTRAAIAGSAFLFAAIHPDPNRWAFALAIGLALAVLRLRTGSISPTILAHAGFNTLTFVIAPFADDPNAALPQSNVPLGILMLAGGTLALWILLRQKRRRRPSW